MWMRADLKQRGKLAFKRNYWSAVLTAFVMMIVSGLASGSATNGSGNNSYTETYTYGDSGLGGFGSAAMATAGIIAATVIMIISILVILFQIFIGNALLVGGKNFFVLNQTGTPSARELGHVFRSGNYGNVTLTMFLKDLYEGLWMLLFIIPGIVKHYEYLMIPYILAENPGMNRKEAFMISKRMMMGQKWEAFVLDMSFIGWRILETLTLGIVGIFYVEPYYEATVAEMYSFNRSLAYQNGYIR